VSGHSMVLSLMACAFISAGISRLIAKPMYTELAALLPVASEQPANRLLPHSAPEHSVPSKTGRR